MDFPVDLSERKPVFVKVHIAIAPAKKAQRLFAVTRIADWLPFAARRPIRPIHRNEGVFRQLIQKLREIRLQRICANRKAELKGVAILRSEGDVSVMPMKDCDWKKVRTSGLLILPAVWRGDGLVCDVVRTRVNAGPYV
jgi:hypothetical protein